MAKKEKAETTQLNVQVPKATVEALRQMAEREHRSMAKQLVHLIEQAASRQPS